MISVIIAAVIVLLDQVSKILVSSNMKLYQEIPLIKGVLNLKFIDNDGAAFGMLSDNKAVFMIASVLIILLLCFIIYKYSGRNKLFDICIGLILGGGIGNMIDRIRLGYVIDFIDFCPFKFWKYVFNVADSAVVVGCILAVIFLIFDKKTALSDLEENSSDGDGDDE